MTETLFERYKEALRAGHVAMVRGRLEAAAAAYREAVSIAGDRAVPRAALGGVYLRLGDPAAALETYDAALVIAPDDDASMLGRAQALVVLRRTDEAAATYDRLADLRAAAGRLGDAVEAARRAVAIEPDDVRRERHAALAAELRAAEAGAGGPAPGADGHAAGSVEPVAEPIPDPEPLAAEAEQAVARGDAEAAATAALAAARAYRARGEVAAAVEACLVGIGARPADGDLHLLLADLAWDLGRTGQATETYRSLLRLAELDGDTALGEAVRAAAAGRMPGGPDATPAGDRGERGGPG